MSRRTGALLVVITALSLLGCRIHVARIAFDQPISSEEYEAVELGAHNRSDVLAALGPPDAAFYTPDELVFDYRAGVHQATDLRFFVPSDVFTGPFNPLAILSVQKFFFDLFKEPEEFRPTPMERAGRNTANAMTRMIPFTSGEDLLTLRGRQLRSDRLRIVFDRKSLRARQKSLRLATGAYQEDSLRERLLLQTN